MPAVHQSGIATPGIALQDDAGAWYAQPDAAFIVAPATTAAGRSAPSAVTATTDLTTTFALGTLSTGTRTITTIGAYAGISADPRPATVAFGSKLTLELKRCVRTPLPPGETIGGLPALACVPLERTPTAIFVSAGTAEHRPGGKVIYDPPVPTTPPVPNTERVKLTYGDPDPGEVSIEIGVVDVATSYYDSDIYFNGTFGQDTSEPWGLNGVARIGWTLRRSLTIPGDVAVYEGSGIAGWTLTLPDCDPVAVHADVMGQMNVWDAASPNTALAGKYAYSFAVSESSAPIKTLYCGTPREPVEVKVSQLVVRVPCPNDIVARAPKYEHRGRFLDIWHKYTCATNAGGTGQDMAIPVAQFFRD